MAKYDSRNKPRDYERQAREFISIDIGRTMGLENTLKTCYKYRQVVSNMDEELFQFGINLYENCFNPYSLETFVADIKICGENRGMISNQNRPYGYFIYPGISKMPSYKKLLMLANNPNLLSSVIRGYNIARKRELIRLNKLDEIGTEIVIDQERVEHIVELFYNGFNLFMAGKKLDGVIEKIEFGYDFPFSCGFNEGIRQYGFNCGYAKISFFNIPMQYKNYDYFLEGYICGVQMIGEEKRENKSNRR